MEQFSLFEAQPHTEVIPHEPTVSEPTVKTPKKRPTVAPKVQDHTDKKSELMAFLDKYSHRIWMKGGQHLKRSLNQAARFDSFKDNASLAMSAITSEHIMDFLDTLSDEGASASTTNRYSATLSSIFKFATKIEKIDKKPHVPFADEGEGRIRTFSDAQVNDFIDFFEMRGDQWMADLITVGYNTGARRGEIIKIGDEDESRFDRSEKTLTIFKTKNGKQRTIPLNTNAYEAVTRLYEGGMSEYTHRKFYDRWGMLKLAFNLEKDDVFHVLRHTAASKLANEYNVNPFLMADLLGHQNLKTTRKYTHTSQDSLRGLVDALGA